MNFSQKLGLFVLIIISAAYVYFSFFNTEVEMPRFNSQEEKPAEYNPLVQQVEETTVNEETKNTKEKVVKIFILDKSGKLRSVNRTCNPEVEKSCFVYAINELIAAPTKWEKSKGFTSEIPQGTKVISIRESANSVLIDLSSEFEAGGGAESTYLRVKQIIKTANSGTSIPTYLYINGKQANVIGGEGIMVKQPLNERSLDE